MNYKGLQKRAKETQVDEKGRYKKKKRFGKSLANKAPAMFVTILKTKAEQHGGEVYEVDIMSYRASQCDHTTGEYTKHGLNDRWRILGNGDKVQRDLYSAFLIKNKLFGKAMAAFSPEYPTGNFGTNVINGGFVLTDGVNNDANGVKRWYVNETLGKDPYVEYNMNGEKINHIVIYSGSTQPVLRPDGATTRGGSVNPKYVDIKYTVDGSLWESVNFESIEEIELSGSKGCKLGISFTEIQPEKIRVCLKGDSMVSAAENNSLRVKEIEAYYDESINAKEFSRLDSCSIMGVKLTQDGGFSASLKNNAKDAITVYVMTASKAAGALTDVKIVEYTVEKGERKYLAAESAAYENADTIEAYLWVKDSIKPIIDKIVTSVHN